MQTPVGQLTDIPLQSDLQNIGSENATIVTRSFQLANTENEEVLFSTEEAVAEVLAVNELYENQPFEDLMPS